MVYEPEFITKDVPVEFQCASIFEGVDLKSTVNSEIAKVIVKWCGLGLKISHQNASMWGHNAYRANSSLKVRI